MTPSTKPNPYVLQTQGLNKHFYQPVAFQVLKDIDLAIGYGEFVSIMGKSGCGKSTLLYILSTLDTEYEGQLWINNELITGKKERQLAQFRGRHIGFVFQFHYLCELGVEFATVFQYECG
jgi:lipoprotein-releasing system ATP-binding protein